MPHWPHWTVSGAHIPVVLHLRGDRGVSGGDTRPAPSAPQPGRLSPRPYPRPDSGSTWTLRRNRHYLPRRHDRDGACSHSRALGPRSEHRRCGPATPRAPANSNARAVQRGLPRTCGLNGAGRSSVAQAGPATSGFVEEGGRRPQARLGDGEVLGVRATADTQRADDLFGGENREPSGERAEPRQRT